MVVLLSTIVAMFLQRLSLRLGIVSERDLAQACRDAYPKARDLSAYPSPDASPGHRFMLRKPNLRRGTYVAFSPSPATPTHSCSVGERHPVQACSETYPRLGCLSAYILESSALL